MPVALPAIVMLLLGALLGGCPTAVEPDEGPAVAVIPQGARLIRVSTGDIFQPGSIEFAASGTKRLDSALREVDAARVHVRIDVYPAPPVGHSRPGRNPTLSTLQGQALKTELERRGFRISEVVGHKYDPRATTKTRMTELLMVDD